MPQRRRSDMAAQVAHADVLTILSAWVVVDGAMFVSCSNRQLAERVAVLLDRHGLVDVPDDLGALA